MSDSKLGMFTPLDPIDFKRFPSVPLAGFYDTRGNKHVVMMGLEPCAGLLHIIPYKSDNIGPAPIHPPAFEKTLAIIGLDFKKINNLATSSSYNFRGKVVALIFPSHDTARCVLESTVPEAEGILHIMKASMLTPLEGH